jgi:hypothetical protein
MLQIKEHEMDETCYTRGGEKPEILKDIAGWETQTQMG